MQSDDKTKLFRALDDLKNEIYNLKQELNKVNVEKELWFKKRDDNSNKRKELNRLDLIKNERDIFSSKVKDNKAKREELNEKIKSKIIEINAIEAEISKQKKKLDINFDPGQLKDEIKKIRYKFETEVVSFENEKKFMKKIKELKKRLEDSKGMSGMINKKKAIQKEIDDLRMQAMVYHNAVQNDANTSQKKHEELIITTKTMRALKKDGDEAHIRSMELKARFNELNNKLQEKFIDYNKLMLQVNEHKQDVVVEKKNRTDAFIKNKEEMIKAKMKRGEKLTTEDFLVFQDY